ncbi:uncharacterized protein FPRO_14758 [Fusarium proliferatum ET1]|uniref:Uncharacterized protein n=1 Tax=Fusarium proliferatum (strain ET1) TaxID=1227346 RepID=A0A1L7WAW2_FUSPR|nr:uncharacterized protein FPRO_14758 [Fusarium proliferatum ET1]CZR49765.1 uncharacterized protein FPRO_14758 [Fusarium proliferatum ET1]
MPYQEYSNDKWNNMRPVIENLLYIQKKTYKEAAVNLNESGFRVKPEWIQRRVTEDWRGGKNFTKKRTIRHLKSDAYEMPALDASSETRMRRAARRHNIDIPACHLHSLKLANDRHITPSSLYDYKGNVFNAVRKYVDGAFDNHIWTIGTFSERTTHDFLRWACDDPPSVFKVLGYLVCATLCSRQEMHLEAQLLLRYGLVELTTCLDGHSPEALLVFIMLLNFFQDRMPTERDKFLRYCIDRKQPSERAQPLMDILRHIDAAERKSAEPQKHKSTKPKEREEADAEFCANLLHDVATMFINKLKQKLKYDELGYAVIQHMHQTGELEDFKRLTWPDPYLAQENDEAFFSSRANIEHYIVLAVERFGHRELLQIEDVLKRQKILAENSEIREMIDKHLTSLRRPIQRIGYRDNFNNMKKFKEHWSQTTAGWETSLVVKGPPITS